MPQMPSPAIGQYESQVQTPDPFRRITPHADDRAAYAIGSGIEDVGSTLAAIQHQEGVQWVNRALPAMQEGALADQEELKKSAPAGADGYTKTVMDAFQQRADAALAAAPDRQSKQFMQEAVDRLHLETFARATSYEATQRVQFQDQTNQSARDSAGNELLLHPEVFSQRLAERNALVDQQAASGTYKAEQKQKNQEQLAIAATQGLIKSNPMDVITQLKSDSPTNLAIAALDPKQRINALTLAQGAYVDQKAAAITDVFRTGGAQAGQAALNAIDKDPSIPADLRDDVRSRANTGVGQLREEAQRQYAPQITALHESLANGTATDSDRATIMGLVSKNAIGAAEAGSLLGTIDRQQTKDAGDEVWRLSVHDAIQNGTPLDPSRKVVKDAVGTYFQNQTGGTSPGSAPYANLAASIAERTGVVPEPAMSWARASLTSGDPKTAASAASLIGMLQEHNPRALEYADDDKRITAMASTINEAVRSGADPIAAVNQARDRANIPQAEEKRLHDMWAKLRLDQTQASSLINRVKDNLAPGLFDSMPPIPAAMQGEYDKATQRYFDLTGGNAPQARDLAARDIQNIWGLTTINGQREIMPYAPERMFPGLDPQLVRNDMAEAAGTPDPHLIYIDQTARTGGVTWALGVKDKDGAYDIVRDDRGNPRLYNLPVTKIDYDSVQAKARAAQEAKWSQLLAQRKASYQQLYGRDTIAADPDDPARAAMLRDANEGDAAARHGRDE